jgi:hypothetical protein
LPVRPHLLVAVLALAFSSCGETPETPKITESQLSPGVSRTADTTVTVQSASVVQGNWQGLGVQWGAYPHCDTTNKAKGFTYGPLTQAQWDRITKRLDALRPGFMRFMIHTGWRYFDGLDASGTPIVDYENPEMKFLYKCLDYTKSRDITVLFGEWAPRWKKASGESVGPWVNIWNDYNETWADMIANLLHYLI